jgi:hypothetical protein
MVSTKKRPSAKGRVIRREGAFNLDGFPLLAYAPAQHGPGVRVEDSGACVAAIHSAVSGGESPESVAGLLGTTPGHVAEACRYVAEGRPLSPDGQA